MTSLLPPFDLDSDTSWGSSLMNTFMDWTSAPTTPSKQLGKFRDVLIEEALYSSLASLSVTEHHPYNPLELPLPIPAPPPTPFSSPSMISTLRTTCDVVIPTHLRQISQPLRSSVEVERSDFPAAGSSPQDNAPGIRNNQRPNRRRPRPNRPRRKLVYRPLTAAESADPPPVYSAIDPLRPKPRLHSRQTERVTWRDGFRFHRPSKPAVNWSIENRRTVYERVERQMTESANISEGVNKFRNALRRNVNRASRKVKDIPDRTMRTYKRWQIRRAKHKLRWLRKNGFFSDQERMLMRELRG